VKYFVEIDTTDVDGKIRMARDAHILGLPQKDILDETHPNSYIHFGHLRSEWTDDYPAKKLDKPVDKFYGGMGEGQEFDNWGDAMLVSLYDQYQVNENMKDGDIIVASYQGEVKTFMCQHVHVVLHNSLPGYIVRCPVETHTIETCYGPLDRINMYCAQCKEYFSVHEYERENVETKERSGREVLSDKNVIKFNRQLEVQGAPYRWRMA